MILMERNHPTDGGGEGEVVAQRVMMREMEGGVDDHLGHHKGEEESYRCQGYRYCLYRCRDRVDRFRYKMPLTR